MNTQTNSEAAVNGNGSNVQNNENTVLATQLKDTLLDVRKSVENAQEIIQSAASLLDNVGLGLLSYNCECIERDICELLSDVADRRKRIGGE